MNYLEGFPFPNELLLIIMCNLEGPDVRSLGNTCRRLRRFILSNKSKLRRPQLLWKEAHILFGRKIVLSRAVVPDSSGKRRRNSKVATQWEFTDQLFLEDFVNLFFELAPEILFLKCKDLDSRLSEVLRICVGDLSAKTLAIEMDKCSLDEDALRSLLRHFEPSSLHLTGHFDRSILSDKVLPLSCLFSVLIGVNRADVETRTKISGITVRKIVNNWFRRHSAHYDSLSRSGFARILSFFS
ncbi:hypothetical protein Y032_0084g1805 [Ancylostoma ceylanicum]|uniref:F-box domain-containing protein n=1 Tax=Ancylostoma ceylanicum TaxID=53326 RepID=A0A016TQ57_9BILA|nr:hypothetical protein Y032_0084g1805 [Ancylostoma ceylanicum]